MRQSGQYAIVFKLLHYDANNSQRVTLSSRKLITATVFSHHHLRLGDPSVMPNIDHPRYSIHGPRESPP